MSKYLHRAASLAAMIISTPASAWIHEGSVSHSHLEGSHILANCDRRPDSASWNSAGAGRRREIGASTDLGRVLMNVILTVHATKQTIVASGMDAGPADAETIVFMALLR